MGCLNESVIDNRNINKLKDYRVIIIGEIHNENNLAFYNNLLEVFAPDYFISEFAYEDIVLSKKELKNRLSKTTNGKFLKNIPDYQDNYFVYKLAYDHNCKLIGCNPYKISRKDFSMDEEDKLREKFMLERIKKYDKYKCVIQLGDHHLRSIPISQKFLDYYGDIKDDRGIVKDLKVSNPSPIYSYYHNKPYVIISRVKSNYDNEKILKESNSKWLTEAYYLQGSFKYSRKIEKRYSKTSPQNMNNEYVIVQGYKEPMRARSCMLILKGDTVFMSINDDNKVRKCKIPGGTWEHKEDPMKCAIRETQEEVRMNVRNVKHCGCLVEYEKEPSSWVKERLPEDQWFHGYYSEIFVGEYDSEYKGYIKKADRDSLINNGRFYKIDEVKNKMPKEFYQAIQKYLREEE